MNSLNILFYILFNSNIIRKKRHMPNYRAQKDLMCVCISFLLFMVVIAAVGVVAFVIRSMRSNCDVFLDFGFANSQTKLKTELIQLCCECVTLKTDSFSVFSRHHLTFCVCVCVCVCVLM